MKKSTKRICIALLLLVFLLGLAFVAYPAFSSWYNNRHKAEVYSDYQEVLDQTESNVMDSVKESAIDYNQKLFRGDISIHDPVKNGYFEQLNLAGNGIMGYIRIPSINVHLAIYHGVGDKAISTGAGHMPETSLPIGGTNTHAVLSSHSGMASNVLFSELERLKPGDYFYIDILNETLTYQILSQNDIISVLPSDIEHLRIEPGKDMVTLITCVPYSINTHRLLVRGTRVRTPDIDVSPAPEDPTPGILPDMNSIRTKNYIKGILIGFLFAMFLAVTLLSFRLLILRRKKKTTVPDSQPQQDTETIEDSQNGGNHFEKDS